MSLPRLRSVVFALTLLGVAGASVVPEPAWAQDPTQAEKLRLEEEMKKLAAKNAWTGVERNYQALVALKVPLSFEDHFLGAQSARFLGKTFEMYDRLSEAQKIEAKDEILQEMLGIENRYGRIEIKGHPRKRPTLAAAVMPFAPDERKSIEYAMEVVLNTGSFKGMLPLGEYVVGDVTFNVASGEDWQTIEVGKQAGGQTEETSTGLIVYAGPVAILGYSFVNSPQPAASTRLEPVSLAGSGAAADIGAEVGFTQVFGVSATLGYGGLYGAKQQFHGFHGWLAGAFRPGDARFAIGPTYGMMAGKGTGVMDGWANPDPVAYPNAAFQYKGNASLAGVQLTAGYGLLDLDPLQGLLEIGASYQSDGTRGYTSFGMRVGIVPKISRYKG